MPHIPKISVIVPIYNAEKYLCHTIDSVLQQTFRDFELLLVDDGSTDTSGTIIDNYSHDDARIKSLHKENGGVSTTRNLGLDNAIGEYVCFLDSDDYMYPDNLETMYKEVQGFDLLICNYAQGKRENFINIKRNNTIRERVEAKNKLELSQRIYDIDVWYNAVCWNKMYLRSFIEKNKLRFRSTDYFQQNENGLSTIPPENIKAVECEDELWSYEVLNHVESVKRIDWMGVCYFHNPGSRGSCHRAIPEMDWLKKMDELYSNLKHRLHYDDPRYIERINYRFRVRIASFLRKGYYKDTGVRRSERIRRWKDARLLNHRLYNKNDITNSKADIITIWILRHKMEILFDPIFIIVRIIWDYRNKLNQKK